MQKRSRLLISSLAGLVGVGALSASLSFSPAFAANPKVKLSIGDWPTKTDSNYQEYETWETEFQKLYPNVTIKPEAMTWYNDGGVPFYTAAAAGQLPNVNPVPFTEPQKMISAGYAINITKELKATGWLPYLDKNYLKIAQKNGQTYGVPTYAYVLGLDYNVKLFKEAGLVTKSGAVAVPTTWAQVAQDAVKIKAKTKAIGFLFPTTNNYGGWLWLPILRGFGGHTEKKVDGKWKAVFNSPQAVAAMTYLKELRWKYNVIEPDYLTAQADTEQLFGTGQVGMTIGGGVGVSTMVEQYKFNALADFGEAAMPAGPDGAFATTGGGFNMFAPGTTPAQVDAGINWQTFTGAGPLLSKGTLAGFVTTVQTDLKDHYPVGPGLMSPEALVFNNKAPIVKAENAYMKTHSNLNMANFASYLNDGAKSIRPEPPIDAQNVYAALDSVIQAVFANKNANVQALLNQAAKNFQQTFLNNVNG